MKTFCTVSDYNYLIYGLTLYRSLVKVNPDFTLYYLCLDDKAFDKLKSLNLPNLYYFNIKNIISKELKKLIYDHTQFCWASASYFTNWLITEYFQDYVVTEDITYIDSDIYFFSNWKPFFDEIGDKSIGIIKHRFPGRAPKRVGEYNVGIIYFKNSDIGRKCLSWWSSVVLDNTNKYFKTHGTCGDQKYLELFAPLFKDVCVVDSIGHLASWNVKYHRIKRNNRIIWKGQNQKLMFYHFSHFYPDFKHNTYRTNKKGEWHPERTNGVKPLLDIYFEELKLTKKLYVL